MAEYNPLCTNMLCADIQQHRHLPGKRKCTTPAETACDDCDSRAVASTKRGLAHLESVLSRDGPGSVAIVVDAVAQSLHARNEGREGQPSIRDLHIYIRLLSADMMGVSPPCQKSQETYKTIEGWLTSLSFSLRSCV